MQAYTQSTHTYKDKQKKHIYRYGKINTNIYTQANINTCM